MQPAKPNPKGARWMRRIRSRWVSVFIIRCLGIVAIFSLEITLASSLGVAGYGTFSFLLAIVVVVSRLASLGWLNVITRLASVFLDTMNVGLLKGSLIAAHVATGLGIAVAATVLAITAINFDFLSVRDVYTIILPLAAALALLELNRFTLRGLNAGDVGELFPFLLLPAVAAAAVWILPIREAGPALQVYTVVVVGLVLLATVSIIRRLPDQFWACKAEFRVREWTLVAFAMLIGNASDEISVRMAVLVLGSLGNETDAGLYQAAARLSLMTIFILRVLTPVAAPKISMLFHAGRLIELRAIYWRLSGLSFAGALPFVLLFWIFPQWILSWFGPGFEEAAPILRVLSLGYLASAAAGPCATALMMIGRERVYGVLAFASVLVNSVGCYTLALTFGGVGAAVATATVIVLNNGLCVAVFYWATSPRRKDAQPPAAASGS